MDLSGWNHLNNHVETGPFISASDISGPDRMLLVGYDVNRNPFSVELVDGGDMIEIEWYDSNDEFHSKAKAKWHVDALYPNKRAYADRTDLSFAILLQENGGTPTYIDIPTENKEP